MLLKIQKSKIFSYNKSRSVEHKFLIKREMYKYIGNKYVNREEFNPNNSLVIHVRLTTKSFNKVSK